MLNFADTEIEHWLKVDDIAVLQGISKFTVRSYMCRSKMDILHLKYTVMIVDKRVDGILKHSHPLSFVHKRDYYQWVDLYKKNAFKRGRRRYQDRISNNPGGTK